MVDAEGIIVALRSRDESVCTVESLTGGLLCAALTDVPGASVVVHGGLVAYTTEVKGHVVGVDEHLLTEFGAVSQQVAQALAERAREIFGSTWAIATTGVAGPSSQENKPVGTVFVAVAGPESAVLRLALTGDRRKIREGACGHALDLLHSLLE